MLKEFAYEFSTPICDILNSSYAEGVVLYTMGKSHCCAHSKKMWQIKISVIWYFAIKVAETFISDWILADISDKIVLQQYSNVKC